MNIKHYEILEQRQEENFRYIKAKYAVEPARCGNKKCFGTFFTPQKGMDAAHKIFFVHKGTPTVMEATRGRYMCKGRDCGVTFYADACETPDWKHAISPDFRDRVINYWINNNRVSIREAARNFGIGRDYIVEWEDTIADAFYPLINIQTEEYLYFGAFRCLKDPTLRAFVIDPEENVSREGKRHIAFIKDYSETGFKTYEQGRFLETASVLKIRYDYAPGIHAALESMFGNAMLILNRKRFQYYIEDLIQSPNDELSGILSASDSAREELYNSLIAWAERLPEGTPNRESVLAAIQEVTESWDLYESFSEPSIAPITEPVRSDIARAVGNKASFNSIMLKTMYDNEDFKATIKSVGAQKGFTMSFTTGGFNMNDLTKTEKFRFTGKERIPWSGVKLDSMLSYDINDKADEE